MKKHNWFEVNGEFRTKENMTTKEFSDLLDSLGLDFSGSIKYSTIEDSDYRGE